MKTLHTTTNRNVTISHTRVRLVLTLAGIITAILCSMALRYDGSSAERMDSAPFQLLKSSRVVVTDFIGEVKVIL